MRNAFLIVLLMLVLWRMILYVPPFNEGDMVRVQGNVSREPTRYEYSQLVEVAGVSSYLPKYPEVNYGDKVIIEGVVNEKGLIDDAMLIEHQEIGNILYRLRRNILNFYNSSLPQPHSSLVAGVVLGSKSGMSETFWEILRNTGTAHVVVASGMNVTLVGGFLLNTLLVSVNRRKAIVCVVIGIWIYAIMAGFDAPIIRAAIMGTVAFSAQVIGRLNNALRALVISALFMLIVNPTWIRDIGFQLSFLATASLILFESPVNRLIRFVPSILRQDLSTTIAAQIGVTPLLLYYFGTFNILSPFINALVLWTIPIMTILGMIAGTVSLLVPLAGKMILLFIYPLSTWFVMIVELVG